MNSDYENDEENNIVELDLFKFNRDETISAFGCCRSAVAELKQTELLPIQKVKETCLFILESLNKELSLSCLINEITNSCMIFSHILQEQESETQSIDLAFCDRFLRMRHDLLHEYTMKVLNVEQKETDMPFSILGIESNRTPDYIEANSNNIMVLETTVTTDKGKSYLMKGRIESGYKPKYEREFEMLKEMGKSVYYVVLVFDVKDSFDQQYKEDIKNMCNYRGVPFDEFKYRDLELLRRSFCNIQETVGKILSRYFTMIFKTEFVPNKYPKEWIDFLMKKKRKNVDKIKYNLISVGTSTFNKIQRGWFRLGKLLDSKTYDNNESIILKIDMLSNKMRFETVKNRKGISFNQWSNCLNNDDKVLLFRNTITVAGDVEIEDTGRTIEFIYPSYENVRNIDYTIPDVNLHKDTIVGLRDWTYDSYESKIIFNEFLDMDGKYEDEGYEFNLERMITGYFAKCTDTKSTFTENSKFRYKKPFASNIVGSEMFKEAIHNFGLKYKEINSIDEDTRMIQHQKPSFQYPLINMTSSKYCSYKTKPKDFIKELLTFKLGSYTDAILKNILDDKFELGTKPNEIPESILTIMGQMSDIQRLMHKLQMSNKDENGNPKKLQNIIGGDKLLEDYKNKRLECKKLSRGVDYRKNNIAAVRLPTKNKKVINSLGYSFSEEMSHFKQKNEVSTYKGVGRFKHDQLVSEFERLKSTLISPCGIECPDKLYDTKIGCDVALLSQLKRDAVSSRSETYDFLRGMNLYHTAAMVTRFCYTLMYFSQNSVGSDYVMVDNLGTNSALLICKGGKKIFRTKRSKLFRLFYKTYDSAVVHYSRPGYTSNFRIHNISGQSYVLTPWISMEETLLTDGLTFLSRTMGYCMMNVCNRSDKLNMVKDCYFNILLALHGRRKTEEFMHNIRYITVNCMSDISCVDKMLPELADFNYDFIQCYLRESLINNFHEFADSIKLFHDTKGKKNPDEHIKTMKIKHLFDRSTNIDSTEMLTMVIYCTFLMSKAPVTQSLEQVKNLRNMLNTHHLHKNCRSDDFKEQYDNSTTMINDKTEISEYWDKLFSNDFVYDPKYVTLLGNLCADYLLSRKSKGELEQKWSNVTERPWDSMANTAGLRGDKGPDFFGKKGYYIVYDHVMKDENLLTEVLTLLNSEMDDFQKRKKLASFNQTYSMKIDETNLNEVIFHVVDKKQRGGSREIFVMDYKTKINQQPIEKYTAYLCKIFPNEIISVPSNRRLFHIHSNVFERFQEYDCQNYNVVLDCRRWAPHSVINKFVDFLIGMRKAIPKGFFIHCMNFFSLMFHKKVYTRRYVKEIIDKNSAIPSEFKKYLVPDDTVKGDYLEMSYSWMMGIFNYFSSLIHVVNQMHITQILIRCNLRTDFQEFNMHMNAHSDDSGGKMVCKNEFIMRRSFTVYELLLKSCNHMLSDKKCNIGKVYFELLSILYIGNKLLSLISKFAGSFNFHPTDSGYSLDVTEAYSKCIELTVNGATFDQSYIALKIMAYLIWRFYFGNDVPDFYYNIPPQILGMPDSHPINALISGGDCDMIRLHLKSEKTKNDKFTIEDFTFISKHFGDFDNFEDSFLPPIKCQPQIIMSKRLKSLGEKTLLLNEEFRWLVNNMRTDNTALNLLSYLEKIKQKNFCATLQDETIARRISRAFYFRSSKSVVTTKGDFSYKEMREMLNLYFMSGENLDYSDEFKEIAFELREQVENFKMKNSNIREYFGILHSEIISMNKSLDNLSYNVEDIKQSKKNCKPIHINIQRVNTPLTNDFAPEALTAWICYPSVRWALPTSDYKTQMTFLEEFFLFNESKIPLNSPNWLYKLLSKYKGRYIKEFFIHSNMPSGMRDISTYRDILSYLSHNSISGSNIEGLISPYNKLLNVPIEHVFSDFMDKELNMILNIMDFISGLFKNRELYEDVIKFWVNGKNKTNILDYLKECCQLFKDKFVVSNMLLPHMMALIDASSIGVTNGKYLTSSYFHCFVKRQHLIGNVWLGKGKLFINLPTVAMIFEIENLRISGVIMSSNSVILNRYEVAYIDYVLQNAQLPNLKSCMVKVEPKNWMKKCFGLNQNGVFEIAESRSLIYCINNTTYRNDVHWVLSNLDLCDIEVKPRMKYSVIRTDFEGNTEKYILHTFDVPVFSVLKEINDIFNNDHNRELINSLGREYKDYLNEIVGESSQSELILSCHTLLDNYSISVLGNIFKTLINNDKLNVKKLNYREHVYPAQEDGLLDSLIKYKDLNEDFMFSYKNLITPELMYLKSSQPDAFISNLITNLKEKYYSLYNSTERLTILDSLWKVYNQISNSETQNNMISLLTTWGYIGVMGALNETSGARITDSFQFFRYKPSDVRTSEFSKRIISDIFNCLITAYMRVEKNIYMDSPISVPTNLKQLQLTILSFFHNHALTTYTKYFKNNMLYLSITDIRLYYLLRSLFSNEEFRLHFTELTESIPILSNMPIEPEYANDWLRSINTLINCMLSCNISNNIINNNILNQIITNSPNPIVKLKEFTSDIKNIKYDLKGVFHNGSIDRSFYTDRKGIKTVDLGNGNYLSFEFKTDVKYSNVRLPFHRKFILKRPFRDDLEEDEDFDDAFSDLKMEMQEDEPDEDVLENILDNDEWMINKNPRYTRVKIDSTKTVRTPLYRFAVFNVIGTQGSNDYLEYIQNSYETILIISNYVIPELLYNETNNVLSFKNNNKNWINKSIINPEDIIFYVKDSEPIISKHWEYYLNSTAIDTTEFVNLTNPVEFGVYYDEFGVKNDFNLMNRDSQEALRVLTDCIDVMEKKDEEDVGEIQVELENKIKSLMEELKDRGVDVEILKKHEDKIIKHKNTGFDIIGGLKLHLEEIMKEKEYMVEIKSAVTEIIKKNKDKQFIERVFELPGVFSIGQHTESMIKNRSLKDRRLRAEIESLSPGLTDKILSNTLNISQTKLRLLKSQLKLCKAYIQLNREKKKNKVFLLNCITLILNDASTVDDTDCDNIWDNLVETMSNYITADEEDSDSDDYDAYNFEKDEGFIRYRVI